MAVKHLKRFKYKGFKIDYLKEAIKESIKVFFKLISKIRVNISKSSYISNIISKFSNNISKIINSISKIINNISSINIKKIQFNKNIITVALLAFVYAIMIVLLLLSNEKRGKVVEASIEEYTGTRFVTEAYPIFKDVLFAGDSYAHCLAQELGYDTTIYSSPGLTLKELNYCFNSAKKNMKKYIVIFIGPNDFRFNTDLTVFNELMDGYVKMFLEDSKVILCTYLPSMFTDELIENGQAKYDVSDYDDEIKKVADSYDNAYYFDLSELKGKSEYYKYMTDESDKIHFNYNFYVAFINKLYPFIMSLK